MSKIMIFSVSGQELGVVGGIGNGYFHTVCSTKAIDLETGEKLNWRIGRFLEPREDMHTDEELKIIKDLGFENTYIHPWKTCNNEKVVMDYLNKELNIYIDENGDGSTFDGYAFVGEIEKELAEKLSNYYI